jgi:hypothetical protein
MKVKIGGKVLEETPKTTLPTIRVDPDKKVNLFTKPEIVPYNPPVREVVLYNKPETRLVTYEKKVIKDDDIEVTTKERKFAKVTNEEFTKKELVSSRFKILPKEYRSFKIIPNATVKNDKIDLFIDSFANNHKEIYQQLGQFKFSKSGITVPEQDKVFFETFIAKEKYSNYITTNKNNLEYTKQQAMFTWSCKIDENKKEESESSWTTETTYENSTGIEFKFKYTSGLSLKQLRDDEKPLRELMELSRMLQDKERIFIQFGFQPSEPSWHKDALQEVKTLPRRRSVTPESNMKLGFNGFDCVFRVIIVSNDRDRRNQISRGLILAVKQFNGDQELDEKIIKPKNFNKWFNEKYLARKIDVSLFFKNRMIMSWKEISNFIKLPVRKLQTDFTINAIERIDSDIPKILQTKNGIPIGHTEFRGKNFLITLPYVDRNIVNEDNVKDILLEFGFDKKDVNKSPSTLLKMFNNHMKHVLDDFMKCYVVTGSPRMGKDTAIINLIIESAKRGVGAFIPDVIDEKGNDRGMCDSIRDSLPPDMVVDLNIGDYFNPIYFGLEDVAELIGENGINVIADNFVKVLKLDNTSNAQELCSLVAKACRCNIYKMYCFLKSKKIARQVYNELLKKDELLAMEVKFEYLNNPNAGNDQGAKALKTRLKNILSNPHFKNMMAQEPNPEINFVQWIKDHKVVLMRMRKMDIGDIGVQIMMYLVSMKVFWLKKILATDDCTFIVYNEPKQYINEALADMFQDILTESPKFRLAPVFIFHHPDMLGSRDLWNVMQSASLNWFLYKNTNSKMYSSIEENLRPIDVETAMKTKQYECIFLPFVGGEQLTPFFVQMLDAPKRRKDIKMYDNSHLTAEHSKIFGKSVKEVREMILQTEIAMYNEKDDENEENVEQSGAASRGGKRGRK